MCTNPNSGHRSIRDSEKNSTIRFEVSVGRDVKFLIICVSEE